MEDERIAMGAFQQYTVGFVILVFGAAMILNFSGSIFNTYDANVSSETLEKVKTQAENQQPSIAEQRNRTAEISPEESTFLSPQAFGIIGDTISSAGNLFKVVGVFVDELGLPVQVLSLITGIITLKLLWEAVSALFGWDV